jgi:hypothetical protein
MSFLRLDLLDCAKTWAVDKYLEIVIFLVNSPGWGGGEGFAGAELGRTQHL